MGKKEKNKEEPKREKLVSDAYAREWNAQYDKQKEEHPNISEAEYVKLKGIEPYDPDSGQAYIEWRMSQPEIKAAAEARNTYDRNDSIMKGQYFELDPETGAYNTVPIAYRRSRGFQKVNFLFGKYDLDNDEERGKARDEIIRFATNSFTPLGRLHGGEELSKLDYKMLNEGLQILDGIDTQKMYDKFSPEAEALAREVMKSPENFKTTFEENPAGGYNGAIDQLDTEINQLESDIDNAEKAIAQFENYKGDIGSIPLLTNVINNVLSLFGTDLNNWNVEDAKEQLELAKQKLQDKEDLKKVLEMKLDELDPKDYEKDYMLSSYKGGSHSSAYYEALLTEDAKAAGDYWRDYSTDPANDWPELSENATQEEIDALVALQQERDDIFDSKNEKADLRDEYKTIAYYDRLASKRTRAETLAEIDPEFEELVELGKEQGSISLEGNPAYTVRLTELTEDELDVIYYYLGYGVKYGDAPIVKLHSDKSEEEKSQKEKEDELSGQEMAKEYYETLIPLLDERRAQTEYEANSSFVEGNVGAGTTLYALAKILGAVQSLVHTVEVNVTNWITGEWKPLDVNDPGFMISRAGDAFFEGGTKYLTDDQKQVAKVVADVCSVVGVVAVSGPTAPAFLASITAGDTMYQAAKNGATPSEALRLGVVAGTIDLITSKVGLSKLTQAVKTGGMVSKKVLKEMLVQAGIEPAEELVSNLLYDLSERVILGGHSEYEMYVKELKSQYGLSDAEARERATKELYWDKSVETVLLSMFAGAVSYGTARLIGTAKAAYRNRKGRTRVGDLTGRPQERQINWKTDTGEIDRAGYEGVLKRSSQSPGVWKGNIEGSKAKGLSNMVDWQPRKQSVEVEGRSRRSQTEQKGGNVIPMRRRVEATGETGEVDLKKAAGGRRYSQQIGEGMEGAPRQRAEVESLRARRMPQLSQNDVNIVLRGELTEAYLRKKGISLEEFARRIETANGELLAGKKGKARQNAIESLMADEVLRNVEEGEVKSPEGRRDFKYLEGKRETSLSRKRLDRRMEAYERKEVEVPRAGDMQRQAPTQEVPEMQPMPNGPVRQENIDRGEVSRYDEIGGISEENKALIEASEYSTKWGKGQAVKHFSEYWSIYPGRMSSLESRLGLPRGAFNNSLTGFEFFTRQAERVIKEAKKAGNVRESNGKLIYYMDGESEFKKGVIVIVYDGKIQTMMPGTIKSFNKIK